MPRPADDPSPAHRDLLEELRTSEARFRAICEAAPLGIYVSEIPVGVVYVNPAMQRILGRSQEELSGTGWRQHLHPDDAKEALGERASNYDRSAAMDIEARYVRSDGRVIWTHLRAAPIVKDGELRGYVGVMEDMTEQKALQAQLITAGRLASVGTLAAGVAHEVNTPLAVALTNLEWAHRHLAGMIEQLTNAEGPRSGAGELLEGLRKLAVPLDYAHDAARRVSLIVRDLRLFSRPEVTDERTADLEQVLRSAMRMASHEIKHRARLVHDYGDLPWVCGNEARLGQVFLNLLMNAAHAIPEGRVEDQEVLVKAGPHANGMVAVEVKDTGKGISPDVMENIFDPFFTTKDRNLGTGLGLAICHRIVSELGGKIEVESQVGKGSVFRVLLHTVAPAPAAATEPSPPPLATTQRCRVLVIDDDAMILNTVALALSGRGDAITTTSAREALERLLAGERFDAIFCDVMMPGMDGMQFHANLMEAAPALAREIIFFSGGTVTGSAQAFLESVPNRRLGKPFTLAELYALLPSPAGD